MTEIEAFGGGLIPRADEAFIPDEKIRGYLLDTAHPDGATKAEWFISLGYKVDQPGRLAEDLLRVVRTSENWISAQSRFGLRYAVRGRLEAPGGKSAAVITVWFVEQESSTPRFVTAYRDRKAESHEGT